MLDIAVFSTKSLEKTGRGIDMDVIILLY